MDHISRQLQEYSADVSTRFVIDGRFLAKPESGVSRVGCELLRALAEELGSSAAADVRVATPAGVDLSAFCDVRKAARSRGWSGNIGSQLGIPLRYPRATVLSFCNVPPLLAARSVVWIHDANTLDVPDSYPLTYRAWHRCVLEATKLRGFRVVTVSEYAKARLVHYGLRPEQIRVIYNGGDHILRAEEDTRALRDNGLDQTDFLLLVGSTAKHKNLPFALSALLPVCGPSLRIAVVGLAQVGRYSARDSLLTHPRIVVLPRISDGELRALYSRAKAIIAPSLCEGFGLYVAEAMFAGGGPLVLSDRTALPEVAGDAALYFDPTDAESLRKAVTSALQSDIAASLCSAAANRKHRYRWSCAARSVIEYYLTA